MGLRKHLIAGNWKMNGTLDSISEILKIDKLCNGYEIEIALCYPILLSENYEAISHKRLVIGAKIVIMMSGAYTGDVSAKMLKDAGAKIIIVGHSERRQAYKRPMK